jgi:hypothetical protein
MLPPLWHPPRAILLKYLCASAGKFPVLVMPGHRKAPPAMGQGWRKGGNHILGFLPSRDFFFNNTQRTVFVVTNREPDTGDMNTFL